MLMGSKGTTTTSQHPWLHHCGCWEMLGAGLQDMASALPRQLLVGTVGTRQALLVFLFSVCCELF